MTKTEKKLILLKGMIVNLDDADADSDAHRLHTVLTTMERALVRDKDRIAAVYEDILEMKQAIQDAGDLLHHLIEDEAEQIQGWFHGAPPINQAFALANLLSRIILELSDITLLFQEEYPDLAHLFA